MDAPAAAETRADRPRGALAGISLATAAMISSTAIQVGIAALIPLVRRDLQLEAITIGAVAATPFVTATLSVRFASAMIARWGPGSTIGITQLICCAATIVC